MKDDPVILCGGGGFTGNSRVLCLFQVPGNARLPMSARVLGTGRLLEAYSAGVCNGEE